MREYQVTCICRSPSNGGFEHITHIGGVGSSAWRLTKQSVIRRIAGKSEAFYTVDRNTGKKAYIGVVYDLTKEPYLRTYADGVWNDNLLSLPPCADNMTIID